LPSELPSRDTWIDPIPESTIEFEERETASRVYDVDTERYLDQTNESTPTGYIRTWKVTPDHRRAVFENRDNHYSFTTDRNGYKVILIDRNAVVIKHDCNNCSLCYDIVRGFADGGQRHGEGVLSTNESFNNGRWDLPATLSHPAIARLDGQRYALPNMVIEVNGRNDGRYRTIFTDESDRDTEHDPRLCWDCIMMVTRHNDGIQDYRRAVTGRDDGDMNLRTGGFWYDDHWIESDNRGLPPDTQIRLNEQTEQFEMVTPNGQVFKTVQAVIELSPKDEVSEVMKGIMMKIDDNEDMIMKLKQHLQWFSEYGVK